MTTLPPAARGASVTALLVSHEGSRWLPAVLGGLSGQTRAPDRVVAVDTGSTDESPRLVREALPRALLLEAPATSAYGAAVRAGLDALPAVDGPDEWVWLLHDDSNPAPDALEQLLAAAESDPSADLLGPKLREWPSLRRLLEVGVTVSGTGRRETGLERGEYDQGQHDRTRDVLAVNTAGMLVRRSVLESLGFDRRLPLFGNDLDLGWRAARAGHRTIVVPDAVVFHVEAAHRGVRPHQIGPAGYQRGERAAAIYTLLVNGSSLALPFMVVRLFLGSIVRVLGLLLVRAPGEAVDELAGLVATYLRPWRVLSGRRARRRASVVPAREVRHLLAPPWMPYRHGLDFLSDIASAVVLQAGDVTAARRARNAAPAETGPVSEESQNLPEDTGLLARLVSNPAAWVFTGLLVAALLAARGLVGTGTLFGGALLPAPGSAMDWWHLHLATRHDTGVGSTSPVAPYVLPLAVVGTVLLGKAWLVVDVLFLLAVPLAAFGAYRFLLRVTTSLPMSLWGAVAYGVLPVVTGAVQEGRLGTVVGTLVLPWLAHAALFLGPEHDQDRRRRAAWRTSLWLALLVAFVPAAWLIALLVAVVALAVGLRGRGTQGLAAAVATPLVATLVLLLPWSVATWTHQGAASWLFEAGLPAPRLAQQLTAWAALTGRPGAGAPGWMALGVLLAAVVALVRPDTRAAVLRAWAVLVVALGLTAVLAAGTFSTANAPTGQPLFLGFPLVLAQAAAITAAALAGTGIRRRLSGSSFGWRQPFGVLVVVLAAVAPVVSTLWWVWSGSDGPLDRGRATTIPTYMTDAAAADPVDGILVVQGSRERGFTYVLTRTPGVRLGDDSVLPSTEDQAALTHFVEDLATAPEPSDVAGLTGLGVAYVYAPRPADIGLVGNLDSVSGLSTGSAGRPGDRAWQVEAAPTGADRPSGSDALRGWLLGLQGIAVVVVAVLAAPTRKVGR
ncbi:MAG: glycosyltransferase [Nocardioidaceae bacterium]